MSVKLVRVLKHDRGLFLVSEKEQDVAQGSCWLLVAVGDFQTVLLTEEGLPHLCSVGASGVEIGTFWVRKKGFANFVEASRARAMVRKWAGGQ